MVAIVDGCCSDHRRALALACTAPGVVKERRIVGTGRSRESRTASRWASTGWRGAAVRAVEIRDVLTRLHPEQRAVLMLRYLEGLDEHTAATILAVPQGTVKSRLFRSG